jgi:hypothetical protein
MRPKGKKKSKAYYGKSEENRLRRRQRHLHVEPIWERNNVEGGEGRRRLIIDDSVKVSCREHLPELYY